MQRNAKDCGPACLKCIAAYHGKKISMQYLREKCFTQRTGSTFLGISEGAESIGLENMSFKLTWEQLQSTEKLPCLVCLNLKHFVVLYKITDNKVWVMDPAYGRIKYKKEAFTKLWCKRSGEANKGSVMLFEPTEEFYSMAERKEHKTLNFFNLLSYLKPFKREIAQVFLGILLGSFINLIFPIFTQAKVDVGIADSDLNFVFLLLVAQVAITLGRVANSFIRNWLMLHITSRVSLFLISDFIAKLMRLPISFFDTKLTGDILQRVKDFDRIQSFLTDTFISLSLGAITFIIYSIIMAGFNMNILLIYLFGSMLHALWVCLFLKRRKRLEYMRFQQASSTHSGVIEIVTGMQDIKLNNCEKDKQWMWEKKQVEGYKIKTMTLSLAQSQKSGALLLNSSTNILVSFLAAKYVITGQMTLGMMMSLQYIIGQLSAPLSQFILFIQDTQNANFSLERLNEINDMDDEESESDGHIQEIPKCESIALDNVSFQYGGKRSPFVLKDIDIRIDAGKTTAIVGTSGSGKTTLLKLLLGFYNPTHGNIYLGNETLNKFSPNKWRQNCGVVMQDGFIFSDTIAKNIAPAGRPNKKRLEKAFEMACISDFVNNLPWGAETRIGPQGMGISTGQRQRLLIARAIYRNPAYIIFDEATNSLDANNEKCIMDNMDAFFEDRTVVVVAHRLSTVKNAHNIIVLDEGRVVEQGTHDELIGMKGHYYTLVKNQLELGR